MTSLFNMIKRESKGLSELRRGDLSRWIFYFSMLIVFALPFHIHATRYLIGGLLAVWLVGIVWKRKLFYLLNQRLVWVAILFYALHVVGLFLSSNTQKAWSELEHKLTLFLLPLAFASVGVMESGRRDRVLLAFVAGTLLVTLVSLAAYIVRLFDPNYLDYFLRFPLYNIYTDFSFFNHPTYYALFLELSIVVAFYLLRKTWIPVRKGWLIAIIVLFSMLVFLASSRSGILSLLVIFMITIFMHCRGRNWKLFWIGMMIVVGFLATQNYRFGNYIELAGEMAGGGELDTDELVEKGAMRLVLWDVALDLSQDHLWFGRGTGDTQDALEQEYERRDLKKHMDRNYNPHNQYLSTLLELGLTGLAVLTGLLLWPLILGIRHGDYLAVAFILLYMSHFMFESILSRSPGILSFAFFYGLLILNRRKSISQQGF